MIRSPDDSIAVDAFAHGKARVQHIAAKLAILTFGRIYVSAPVTQLRRWRDDRHPRPSFAGRTAIVAHAYYPDLIHEILDCFATMPLDADLIVTTSAANIPEVTASLARTERARVLYVENRGRDIAPFLALLNDGVLSAYDVVLKLHTKKSPHLLDGRIRQRLLYTKLAGTKVRTQKILALFKNERMGMAGWRHSWRDSPFFWMTNKRRVDELMSRIGAPPKNNPAFFEGSMFWVRPSALNRLKSLSLTVEDFEPESGQLDGTLHHAIERMFAVAANADGFDVCDLEGHNLLRGATDSKRSGGEISGS